LFALELQETTVSDQQIKLFNVTFKLGLMLFVTLYNSTVYLQTDLNHNGQSARW